MAKVEADKTLIVPVPTPISSFVPTESYRRVATTIRAEAYAVPPPITTTSLSEKELEIELKNALVHAVAKALYATDILAQSISVDGNVYKVNFTLAQEPKAEIIISAQRGGKKFAEVKLA